jgi:RNA polymerase sigma factor (sigma-70 family)
MENTNSCQSSKKCQFSSYYDWHTLHKQLTIAVALWVYSANLLIWISQREEIINDIVQEAMMKVLKRIHQGETGELTPVYSVEGLCIRVAHNVFIDMLRRDRRLVPLSSDNKYEPFEIPDDEDYSEVAVDNVYYASIFTRVALAIQEFSPKLRAAIIRDLVSRMSFDGEETPLQKALINAGINLEEFRIQCPFDPVTKSRQSSLASLGYKKISALDCIQEYM